MRNVVLLCAAGMSTSMLVNKMVEAAKTEGYECNIHAHAVGMAQEVGPDADVILLGPQIRFNLNAIKKDFPDKPVEAIDMKAYGMMDGKAVIGQVKKLLGD